MTDQAHQFKELTSTLYSLKGLSEELAQEKDSILASAGQINFASKQFKNHSEKFETQLEGLQKNVPALIVQEMRNTSKLIAEEASRAFIDIATTQTDTAIKKLLETTQQCQNQVEQASQKVSFMARWLIACCLGAAAIGGLIAGGITYYMIPQLDSQVVRKIEMGNVFEKVWPQLNKKEKERITALYTAQ